jgi:hypothetical protein
MNRPPSILKAQARIGAGRMTDGYPVSAILWAEAHTDQNDAQFADVGRRGERLVDADFDCGGRARGCERHLR